MEKQIKGLQVLVEATSKKVADQVKAGNLNGLVELLWHVPTNILQEFLARPLKS